MRMDHTEFGKFLEAARHKINKSRAQVAAETGINVSLLSKYERGVAAPRHRGASKLAKALGISASKMDLFNPVHCRKTGFAFEEFQVSVVLTTELLETTLTPEDLHRISALMPLTPTGTMSIRAIATLARDWKK